MLDIREINAQIARLEFEESSFSNYQKLASLYVIRDRMTSGPAPEQKTDTRPIYEAAYSGASVAVSSRQTVGKWGDSRFLKAVSNKEPGAVWAILDDLMDTLRVTTPRAYAAVMDKVDKAE